MGVEAGSDRDEIECAIAFQRILHFKLESHL